MRARLLKKKGDLSRSEKSKRPFHIGIDLMGCDAEPQQIIDEVLAVLPELVGPHQVVFFGTSQAICKIPSLPNVSSFCAEEVISMDEDPLYAVRRKKNSSISVAMKQLRAKTIDALISAGNTGALVASANLFLKLPHIDRAALLTLLPTKEKPVAVLDVGANPLCKAHHLVEYAAIGIAYQKSLGIENPKVGLLNIGTESMKGTTEVRSAYKKLEELHHEHSAQGTFKGNIEGRDVFNGSVDVIVTDGFTGNVFLKTAEGIASFILHEVEEHTKNPDSFFYTLRKRLHYTEYPGATIAGVDGIVVKCHGDGSPSAFRKSVKAVSELLKGNFLSRLKEELALQTHHWKIPSLFR